MKYEKYAVFIDIDETLDGGDEALKKNIAVIQKVRKAGHYVLLNTGRSTAFIPEKIRAKEDFDGAVTGCGAVARVGEKVIFKKLMPEHLIRKFNSYVLEQKLKGYLQGYEEMYYYIASDYVEPGWTLLSEEKFSELMANRTEIEKFSVSGEIPPDLDEVMGEECEVLRFPAYGEILQRSCGKGKALLEVAEYLGISQKNTIAMGDSMNDYEMLTAAGISVAMGNADDRIKAIADMVTETANEAGVAAALEKIFKV